MIKLMGGRYKARLADTADEIRSCQRLRFLAFRSARGLGSDTGLGLDQDEFDVHCRHFMVEDTRSSDLVCAFRMMPLNNGTEISRSYSAKYYDLKSLRDYPGKMVEMGRFCMHPDVKDPSVIRIAWSAMTKFVEDEKVELLFGCSSFHGTDADQYMDAFALLKAKHLAPARWLPRVKAPNVFNFARLIGLRRPNMKLAIGRMPPLLRTYLVMGGWVSDHAVIDKDLNTLHVFTGVEIARVPAKRARILRGS